MVEPIVPRLKFHRREYLMVDAWNANGRRLLAVIDVWEIEMGRGWLMVVDRLVALGHLSETQKGSADSHGCSWTAVSTVWTYCKSSAAALRWPFYGRMSARDIEQYGRTVDQYSHGVWWSATFTIYACCKTSVAGLRWPFYLQGRRQPAKFPKAMRWPKYGVYSI